ncbi:ran-binding protein 9-like [Diadema antillarum]|uniref:ran-binding protein 9-like n=1 Tax=Diadema antillarum TaxID=105358 RepID=UPI003A88E8F5
MATNSGERSCSAINQNTENSDPSDRLRRLYPAVNEDETPLPRTWNPRTKSTFIGLSQHNLRLHYKGMGKTHKDAASVTTAHPIPASCGIYYFEVTIVSKGREGYMGIGLSTEEFGSNMSRLPGWDKHSYGYHGDNGHTFNSTGNGQPYGPTFTTRDIVGCGINLVDGTCFYTKNGVHLGIAFTDLPSNLYPTVGLQTPGEVVDTNFGQSPFMFNIEDLMQEMRMKTATTIERHPVPDDQGEWQSVLHRIVSTYLVHHGYCATAESFAKSTRQTIAEEVISIKNRQRLQRLVLAGRMGEAIETTQRLYPTLLQQNPNLEFMLKCRQFVEMVSGTDSEIRQPRGSRSRPGSRHASPAMSPHRDTVPSSSSSSSSSSSHLSISSPLADPMHMHNSGSSSGVGGSGSSRNSSHMNTSKPLSPKSPKNLQQQQQQQDGLMPNSSTASMNALNLTTNGSITNGSRLISAESDIEMDVDCLDTNGVHTNGTTSGRSSSSNGHAVTNGKSLTSSVNGVCPPMEDMETDDVEVSSLPPVRQLCGGSHAAIKQMLKFGRELQCTYDKLTRENGKNEANEKALQDAFSLLAYADPWNSPVGYQLDSLLREPVCAALNSAILESQNMPKHPPLELALCHVTETMKLMSKHGAGSCAFSGVDHYLN